MSSTRSTRPAILGGDPAIPMRPWPIVNGETRQLVIEALDGGSWAYNTDAEVAFNEEFAAMQAGPAGPQAHAVAVTNGTHAIRIMLDAAGIGFGDEVVTTLLSWQATVSEIVSVNATPRMVGVLPGTLGMDPAQVQAAINPRTKAILAMHPYGSQAEMDPLVRIATERRLALFEDCAHAQGSQRHGIGAGVYSDGGTFSFFEGKNLPLGEAGADLTRWGWLADRIDRIRNCGRPPVETRWDGTTVPDWWWLNDEAIHAELHGGNDRVGGLAVAAGLGQLRLFPQLNDERLVGKAELDAAAAAIEYDGVRILLPMDRQSDVNVPPTYAYILRYIGDHVLGLTAPQLREILTAEFGGRIVEPTYTPLSHSELYRPLSLARVQLSPEYIAAITPARYADEVADLAWLESLMLHHTIQFPGAGAILTAIFKDRIFPHLDDLHRFFANR